MFLNILRISASNVLKTLLNIIVSIGCTFVVKTTAKTAISGHLTAIVLTFVFHLYQHSNLNFIYKYRYTQLKIGNSC